MSEEKKGGIYDKVTVTVTQEGNDFKGNKWKTGQKVTMSRVVAEKLALRGLVELDGFNKKKAKKDADI